MLLNRRKVLNKNGQRYGSTLQHADRNMSTLELPSESMKTVATLCFVTMTLSFTSTPCSRASQKTAMKR